MGLLEQLSRFVDSVSDTISITFKNISDFLDLVHTFFVSLGFWVSVLMFFLMLILLIYGPILLFKYWDSIKSAYTKIFKTKVLNKLD